MNEYLTANRTCRHAAGAWVRCAVGWQLGRQQISEWPILTRVHFLFFFLCSTCRPFAQQKSCCVFIFRMYVSTWSCCSSRAVELINLSRQYFLQEPAAALGFFTHAWPGNPFLRSSLRTSYLCFLERQKTAMREDGLILFVARLHEFYA